MFTAEWTDYPSALAECGGDEERAAEQCHCRQFERVVKFDKFGAAVRFAHSKIGDDFFGCPRVYRWVQDGVDWRGEPTYDREAFWDCDDPDQPVFEAMPSETLLESASA